MSETFDIQGQALCAICCEESLQKRGDLAPVQPARLVDPTVCATCGADNGDTPHRELHRQPTCAACARPQHTPHSPHNLRHPVRGVAAFVAVAVFVIVLLGLIFRSLCSG